GSRSRRVPHPAAAVQESSDATSPNHPRSPSDASNQSYSRVPAVRVLGIALIVHGSDRKKGSEKIDRSTKCQTDQVPVSLLIEGLDERSMDCGNNKTKSQKQRPPASNQSSNEWCVTSC